MSIRRTPANHTFSAGSASAPRSFRIMFAVVASFIVLTAIAAFVMVIFMFSNGGVSYKVDYQFGNSSYSKEYSYNR